MTNITIAITLLCIGPCQRKSPERDGKTAPERGRDAENIGTTTGGRTGRASDIIPGGQYNSVAAAQTKTDRVISG